MKKFLFSLVAIGMSLSFASCNSEEDLPTPVVPDNQTSLEATFPKGSAVKQIQVSIPKEMRTRSEEGDVLLNWDMFNNEDGCLYIHYAVYNSDGSLYYSSDFAAEQDPDAIVIDTTTTNGFGLTFPVNGDDPEAKLFIWADKDKQLNKGAGSYKIDWENKTVSLPDYAGLNINELGKLGDAWYALISTQNHFSELSQTTQVMKRPFVQVNLLSDEMTIQSVYEKFSESGVRGTIGFNSQNQGALMYLPKTWHWETDEIDFELPKYGNNQFYLKPEGEHFTAKLNSLGRSMDYIASVYFFAPSSGEFKDAATGKLFDKIIFSVTGGNTISLDLKGQSLKANTRFFIMNRDISDFGSSGGGILTKGGSEFIQFDIDDSYDVDGDYMLGL